MWLFLPYGFYSIVDKAPRQDTNIFLYKGWEVVKTEFFGKKGKPYEFPDFSKHSWFPVTDFLCVRSRDQESLKNLIQNIIQTNPFPPHHTGIIEHNGSDYQYRMWIDKKSLSCFMKDYIANQINFGNFKNQTTDKYHSVFSKVWGVLWDLVRPQQLNQDQLYLEFPDEEDTIGFDDMTDQEISNYWEQWGEGKK